MVIFASPKTVGHPPKARLVATIIEVEQELPTATCLGLETVHQIDNVLVSATGAVARERPRNGDGEMGLAGSGAADDGLDAALGGQERLDSRAATQCVLLDLVKGETFHYMTESPEHLVARATRT